MKSISEDLFYKIRSRFQGLKLGKETGEITINPAEAAFFDFDYMEGENPIGHISISLAEPTSMKVYYSTGITEAMDVMQKDNWYGFLKELRQFAKRRLLSFDTRDIAKDNLDKRDFMFLSQNAKTNPVGESVMSESNLYGTKTMSFQKLLDTKLIIKHSHALTDDMAPGARSRNIAALFVQNEQGERFKYPFIHLAGARAMQRHVANGGKPYDEIGGSIVKMSEEIAQLKSFSNYVVRNDLMNSDTNSIVERSSVALERIREQIKQLSKQSHYEAYKSNFQVGSQDEIPQEVVEDFTEKFTVKNFKEDIKTVFPILYRLMKEHEQSNEIGYDDIVEMTADEQDEVQAEEFTAADPFEKFEQWAMSLGEASAITSQDEEEKAQAVSDLQELVGQHFPPGVDGTNAIQSLKGIIEDPALYKEIKDQAKEDADSCVRPLVKAWLEQNVPDVVAELDFGDMTEPGAEEPEAGAEEPAAQEQPVTQSDDNEEGRDRKQGMNVQELAEFIHSFYDKETNSFPKGPEGVATMVGKKFGERAEQVARKMVERMAPQQATDQNPKLAELARIKELSGLQSSEVVTQEAAGNYMWQEVGDEADQRQLSKMADRLVKMYQRNAESSASDEEIKSVIDDVVREFVPQVGKLNNIVPVAQAFFDKLPIKEPEPEYDDDGEEMEPESDVRGDFITNIWSMVKITAAAEKGDTSSYGYKVHPNLNKESSTPELEDIRRLSGISQGIRF